jgi:integrase
MLFINTQGRPVTGKGYYRAFSRASAAAGLRARPHQARSTFATRVRDKLEQVCTAGAEIDVVKVVQALLAHADACTTEQYLESIDVPSLDVLRILDELAGTALGTACPR